MGYCPRCNDNTADDVFPSGAVLCDVCKARKA